MRSLGLLVAVVLCCSVVAFRLVQLQVLSPDDYAARGVAQRLRTVVLPAERGSIFDRNGAELAMSVRQQTVWVNPKQIADPGAAATALAGALGQDRAGVLEQLTKPGTFVYLARQVDDAVAEKVRALGLLGVNIVDESARFNPAGSLAASVLGDVDLDNLGVSGLERQFESNLLGIPGELVIERGPDGRTIAGGRQSITPSQRGQDLVLTIDRSLQFEVERALAEKMNETGAERATALVMDPTTGEILAMANLTRDEAGNPVPGRENRALTAAFEPGSVNKVVTLAAALEEGVVTPDTVFEVPDRLRVSVHEFSDSEPHPTQRWSVNDILTKSSNIGTIKVAQSLGEQRVASYLRRFGLGQLTGLGFPQETPGIMKTGRWDGTDIGSIPIGQGVAVNALQMLQVFNTLANGGEWIEPRLVRATVDGEGNEELLPAPARRRVVSQRTAEQMTAMLVNVVEVGTGVKARIQGYTVAGKTGTARKPSTETRGYEPGAYISSFAGFVPAQAPKLSAIVVLDEPQPYYAGLVAAPVFARVNQYALRTLRIPPPAVALEADVPTAEPVPVDHRD